MDTTNRFIQFEGMDGSGKTTILKEAEKFLKNHNKKVLTIRMPGGVVSSSDESLPFNDGGEYIREFFLSKRKSFHTDTALFLALAAYRENLIKYVRPFLDNGGYVLCDRGVATMGAYHTYLLHCNQVPADTMVGHQEYLLKHQQPVVVYLDVNFEVSQKRLLSRGDVDSSSLDIKQISIFNEIKSNMLYTIDRQSHLFSNKFMYDTMTGYLSSGDAALFVQEVLAKDIFTDI